MGSNYFKNYIFYFEATNDIFVDSISPIPIAYKCNTKLKYSICRMPWRIKWSRSLKNNMKEDNRYIYLSIYLSNYLSIYSSNYLSICLSTYLSIEWCIILRNKMKKYKRSFTLLSIYLFIYQYNYLSI